MQKGIFNFKLLQIPSKVAAHDNEFIFATDAKSFLIATPQVCIICHKPGLYLSINLFDFCLTENTLLRPTFFSNLAKMPNLRCHCSPKLLSL